jgi:hypothetical protein
MREGAALSRVRRLLENISGGVSADCGENVNSVAFINDNVRNKF